MDFTLKTLANTQVLKANRAIGEAWLLIFSKQLGKQQTIVDNQLKNISGKQAKILVSEMLNNLKEEFDINLKIKSNYSVGYPNQQKQFKAHFSLKR